MMTVKQVLDFLNISRSTLHRLTKHGLLPAYKLGRTLRYKREEIEEYLRKQRTEEGKLI